MLELRIKLFASYKRRNMLFTLMERFSINIKGVFSMEDEMFFSVSE